MLVTLRGGFHGNCTRAAFSASEVFRSHAAAGVLVDMQVRGEGRVLSLELHSTLLNLGGGS
jgi:hypothetical protein